jgi:mannitol-1-phosphate 5-dehydrogenase
MKGEVLVFGAGNIGRSFITPLFLDAGYTVHLADIDTELITGLKQAGSYTIRICAREKDSLRRVEGFFPLTLTDSATLAPLVRRVPLIVTCVGRAGLEAVASLIGELLPGRQGEYGEYLPLDIILAENLRDASEVFRRKIKQSLKGDFPVESRLGLVETSIGKMVPLLTEEERRMNPLGLKAEAYDTLILDRDGFVGHLPESPSIRLVSPIRAWVDRKLFLHNMGHAAAAYLGRRCFPGEACLASLMKHERFFSEIRDVMMEGAGILLSVHPGVFRLSELEDHIDDLLERFANPSLGDSVQRIGRDLRRKLGRNDRIVGALREAVLHNLPLQGLGRVYLAALVFEESNPQSQDHGIARMYREQGLEAVYSSISCGGEVPDEIDHRIITELKRLQSD